MKRVLVSVVVGGAALLLAGCADTGPLETRYEVTGDAGAKVVPLLTYVGENGQPRENRQDEAALPWSQLMVIDRGATTLTAQSAGGALTCRIIVEGRTVAEVTGQPGQPVTCKGDVDE